MELTENSLVLFLKKLECSSQLGRVNAVKPYTALVGEICKSMCYHSTYNILRVPTIEKEAGIRVAEIGLSGPQGGKGPADRMAATIKGHITRS